MIYELLNNEISANGIIKDVFDWNTFYKFRIFGKFSTYLNNVPIDTNVFRINFSNDNGATILTNDLYNYAILTKNPQTFNIRTISTEYKTYVALDKQRVSTSSGLFQMNFDIYLTANNLKNVIFGDADIMSGDYINVRSFTNYKQKIGAEYSNSNIKFNALKFTTHNDNNPSVDYKIYGFYK